jgi:peptide/nickel transport system ATP-binding protein
MKVDDLKTAGAPADAMSRTIARGSPLLELRNVTKRFQKPLDGAAKLARLFGANIKDEIVHAVDGVDITVNRGEVVGLVGESGCGKSTIGRMAVGLHSLTSGERLWKGAQIDRLDPVAKRREQLGIQMVFQDPYASLNPRLRVQDIIGEAPVVHGIIDKKSQRDYVSDLLRKVGLDPQVLQRFPHQFSGGQRARVGIARALAVNPELIVCDEAVAALDVSVQAQVLNLFMALRQELQLTYLFISHDLSVVRHLSDRVVIMYLGRVVESGPAEEIFSSPNHPYTQGLLAEATTLEVRKKNFIAIKGEIPSPLNPPSGCHFHPRCPHAKDICKSIRPTLAEIAPDRFSACHLNG